MEILPYKTDDSKHNLTSRASLVVVAELIKQLQKNETVDWLLPSPGNNLAYRQSCLFNTFLLMKHEGGKCLEDIRQLQNEPALMKLLRFDALPNAKTLGN